MANAPAPEQYMAALRTANDVRTARAELKLTLGADTTAIVPTIMQPPRCAESAKVEEMLCSLRGIGPDRAGQMLRRAQVPFGKRLRALTERQRHALVSEIRASGRPTD